MYVPINNFDCNINSITLIHRSMTSFVVILSLVLQNDTTKLNHKYSGLGIQSSWCSSCDAWTRRVSAGDMHKGIAQGVQVQALQPPEEADTLPRHQSEEDLRLGTDILNGRRACTNLTSQHIVEHLCHILLAFKIYAVQILQRKYNVFVNYLILTKVPI